MIAKLEGKAIKQVKTIKALEESQRTFKAAKQKNRGLRKELMEMKDLMKGLLFEREELRMFNFYQDE